MGKILTAFADENLEINPVFYKGSAEYQQAVETIYRLSEELDAKHNEEEKKMFEQFRDALETESSLYAIDRFISGYRLGVLMTMEVFAESDSLFLCKEDK